MPTNPKRSRPTARRLAGAAVAAAALAAAAPAAAQADSILTTRDGNLWLSTPDGARSFQVTTDGGWTYGSQSADGSVIVGSKDRRLFVLARTGEIVRELSTVIGSIWWQGPFEPQVSPNGQHVAYQYYTTTTGTMQTGVAYAATSGSNATYELHTGWGYPTWIDDATLMHSDPPNALSMDVIVRGLGQPNNEGDQWFRHDELDLRDGDIHGNRMAFVGGKDGEYLPIYRFDGPAGSEGVAEYCYHYRGPAGRFEGPAFAPDGTRLAWGEGDGVYVGTLGDLSQRCEQPATNDARLVLPGHRFPDWSGADVPADRVPIDPGRDPGRDPGTDPGRDPRRQAPPIPRPARKPRLSVARARLATALKRGLPVSVRGASGTVRLTATVSAATARRAGLGRRAAKVASGAGTARGSAATVRLRFTPAAVKRLRRLGVVRLTIAGAGVRTTATLKR